ncbi:MAG: DUF3194 domain-containing protein [Candidatus Bathyarchaeales archaeon]
MEEIGLPELSPEQKEDLCNLAENAARKYVTSKIPLQKLATLNITVEVEGEKPITVNIDVELSLTPNTKYPDLEQLAKEATHQAQETARTYLKEISCKSKK